MKQMVNPTILTHIWNNSCTAGSNQLLAYFFAEFAIFLHPSSCHAWWNAILNGLHKYFWMERTNTFEWTTQILCLPAQYSISTGKPNNTAGHCRETYFGTKYKYLYWLGRSNNIGLANKELLLQFMFAKCNAIPEEIQIQDNWKHK